MGCECESFKWVIVNRFLLIHDDWTFTSMDTKICSPTNKFWGKALFLHLSVILFTGEWGLCMMSLPVWLAGDSVQGGSLYKEVSVRRGSLSRGVSVRETPHTVKSGRYASCWNSCTLEV